MSATMASVKESLRSGTSVCTSCSSMYSRHSPLTARRTISIDAIVMPLTRWVRRTASMYFCALLGSAAGSERRRGYMFS